MAPLGTALTFVTVSFAAETPLLELQLRSMSRFLDPEQVAELIVINNERRRLSRRTMARLRRRTGGLSDRLRFVERNALVDLPRTPGWRSQQVLKLEIARKITTPVYVLLDAKNHLLRQFEPGDLMAPDGRARGASHPYHEHPLRDYLVRALDLFNLSHDYLDDFPATATPFVMHTDVVRTLLERFPADDGHDFGTSFEQANLTEFFLYSAWIRRGETDASTLYDGTPVGCPVVWAGSCSASDVARERDSALEMDAAFFAIHRRALGKMDLKALQVVAEFWYERGLFSSVRSAQWFILRFRARYFPLMALKKVGDRRLGRRRA